MSCVSSESGMALTANENDLAVADESCAGDNDNSVVYAVASAEVDSSATSLDAVGAYDVDLCMNFVVWSTVCSGWTDEVASVSVGGVGSMAGIGGTWIKSEVVVKVVVSGTLIATVSGCDGDVSVLASCGERCGMSAECGVMCSNVKLYRSKYVSAVLGWAPADDGVLGVSA